MKIEHKKLLAISIILFLASFTQPAFYIDRTDFDAWSNPFVLITIGWLAAMGGGSALAWLANPLIFISWGISIKSKTTAIVLSVLASLFALLFFISDEVVTSEAPTYSKITEYKSGYWIWLSSILSFTIGLIINSLRKETSK